MKTGSIIMALATAAIAAPFEKRAGGAISITPHDEYSSSIGVLGCKINTNNVAYWPGTPGCNDMCVKVSANGRSVKLLRVDSSGGAYDISYNAWNYLKTGKSAQEDPQMGGGFDATYEQLPMSECTSLMTDGKLALSAANSMNFVASCMNQGWFANNYELFNIQDPACTLGVNVKCSLDLAVSNQPSCGNTILGTQVELSPAEPVYNIIYGTGKKQIAA